MSAYPASASVCAVNLGPRQARLRLLSGIAFLSLGLATAGVAVAAAGGLFARVTSWSLFSVGVLSLLQARAKT